MSVSQWPLLIQTSTTCTHHCYITILCVCLTVMRELICLLLVGVVSEVMGQTYPLLRHKSIEFSNNSFINRGIISISDPLRCVTDRTPCCGVNAGVWRDPEGAEVREGASGATDFYITRSSEGEINLHRISGGLSGMWLCEIPDSAGDTQRLYIYLGIDTTGELGWISCMVCV